MTGNHQSSNIVRIVKLSIEFMCSIMDITVASKSTLGRDLGQYMQTRAERVPRLWGNGHDGPCQGVVFVLLTQALPRAWRKMKEWGFYGMMELKNSRQRYWVSAQGPKESPLSILFKTTYLKNQRDAKSPSYCSWILLSNHLNERSLHYNPKHKLSSTNLHRHKQMVIQTNKKKRRIAKSSM